jgi:hypothetical protein
MVPDGGIPMSGEPVTEMTAAAKAKAGGEGDGRQRSTISFPYDDLSSVIELSLAIHNQVGAGEGTDDQLAAWTKQSPKSSGFRSQLSAARMFGLLESPGAGRHRLSVLGRMIVDPQRAREAKVTAFLNVPLYKAVFEMYRGGVMPPAAALERDIEGLGVAETVKRRARQVLERCADQGGTRPSSIHPGTTQDAAESRGAARVASRAAGEVAPDCREYFRPDLRGRRWDRGSCRHGAEIAPARVMNEAPLSTFERAIRATHGAGSNLVARERVTERFKGETVWQGEVLVFELQGHPSAKRCYAWEVDGEVTAVLEEPPVHSARDAVRAALLAD